LGFLLVRLVEDPLLLLAIVSAINALDGDAVAVAD